jgi:threonine dehydratase
MIKLREIYDARRRVQICSRKTPIEYSPTLSKLCGGDVWFKLENYQKTGSFKIRGATNKLLLLDKEERKRGVVTASSGNHAQGVGYVARKIGVEATIVVPINTPKVKIEAIRDYGVDLIIKGEEYMDSEKLAREIEVVQGKTFVSAYNDIDIILGQGTLGLEMMEELPDLDIVIVPVGGGGLASGIATVFHEASDVEIIGVQSFSSPVMYECVKEGKIIDIPLKESIAEGLHGGLEKGSITFDICKDLIDNWIIVEEEDILKAIKHMLHKHHMLIEGAAAVGPAAILDSPERFRDKKIGIIISGGNLAINILKKVV